MPPQLMPPMHVCLKKKKLAVRIMEFEQLGGQGSKGRRKPESDELVHSWHGLLALNHALDALNLPDALNHFASSLTEKRKRLPWPERLPWPVPLGIQYTSIVHEAAAAVATAAVAATAVV